MAITISTHPNDRFIWIDLLNPTENELLQLSEDQNLNKYAVFDCLEPDHLPKFEEIDQTHFLLTRLVSGPSFQTNETIQSLTTKLAFFYRENLLITIHRQPLSFLEIIKEKYFINGKYQKSELIIAKILLEIIKTYESHYLPLSNQMDQLENEIFTRNHRSNLLTDLYKLKSTLSILKHLLMFSQSPIESIELNGKDKAVIMDVLDRLKKITHFYVQAYENSQNLISISMSISSQQTNEIMKLLTIFSVFFMPLTFIVGIYGMNFENMPELSWEYGYFSTLVAMLIVSIIIYLWFRKKRII